MNELADIILLALASRRDDAKTALELVTDVKPRRKIHESLISLATIEVETWTAAIVLVESLFKAGINDRSPG